MPAIVMVIVGLTAGMLTMTVVSFYKWFLEMWNGGMG